MNSFIEFRDSVRKFMDEHYGHSSQNEQGKMIFGETSGGPAYSKFLVATSVTYAKWERIKVRMAELGMEVAADEEGGIPNHSVQGLVSAGPLTGAEPDEEPYLNLKSKLHPSLVCLRVRGSSCEGFGILDGDYVFVKQGHFLENGQILVFQGPDDAYTLKAYYRKKLYGYVDGKLKVVASDANLKVFGMVEYTLGSRRHSPKQGEPRWLANLGG